MGLLRYWVLCIALFEFLPLAQLWLLKEELHTVAMWVAAHNSNHEFKVVFSLMLVTLIGLRLSVFFAGANLSKGSKWALVAVHAVEIAVIGPLFLDNVYPRRHLLPTAKYVPQLVVMGFIVINPLLLAMLPTARARSKSQ